MKGRAIALPLLAALGCATAPARPKGELVPLAGVAGADVTRAAAPRRIALLLGVDHYDDPFWPKLVYAQKDATDLAEVLRAGGFDEVTVLPAGTDKRALAVAFEHLAERAPRPEDTVLFYASGHGTLAVDPKGEPRRVLVLEGTQKNDLFGTGVDIDELAVRFDALPSRRKVMVLATCHSGSGKSLLTPEVAAQLRGIKGALLQVSRAAIVLSAADLGQSAREDDRLENDVYTHFLIEAVRAGADADGDGAVTVMEAHDYARSRTFDFTQGAQVPSVEALIVGVDPIVLAGRIERPALPVLYSYAPRLSGVALKSEGRQKGVLPGSVVLDQGEHEIELTRSDGVVLYQGTVDLRGGERVAVESLIASAEPRWSIGALAGIIAIADSGVTRSSAKPLPGVTITARLRDIPFAGIDPIADLTFGFGDQIVQPGTFAVPQRVLLFEAGLGLAFKGEVGPVELHGGPHLAFMTLVRSIALPGLAEDQVFGTILPGFAGGVAVPLGSFDARLEARVHFLPLVVDNEVRSLLRASLFAGAGYRF